MKRATKALRVYIPLTVIVAMGIICFGNGTGMAQSGCKSLLDVQIGRQWGYIDQEGGLVIPPQFDFAEDFDNGIALVEKDGTWGIIDERGNWVNRALPSSERMPWLQGSEQRILIRAQGKAHFIAIDGRPIPGVFDDAVGFSEGLASIKLGNKWGFINREGKTIIAPKFDSADFFAEGKAEVKLGPATFFVDQTGRKLFDVPSNMLIGRFNEGLARFQDDASELYGFIDERRRVAIKPQFPEAGDFVEGVARVRVGHDWGFIDKKGKVIIEPKYWEANDFSEGLASVRIGDKWGFIRKDGSWAIRPTFYNAFDFKCGLASVELEDSRGYVDTTGSFIFSTKKLPQ